MRTIKSFVEEKINENKDLSRETAAKLFNAGISGDKVQDHHIKDFYIHPENGPLKHFDDTGPTNIPNGVSLRHFIFWGRKVVFDLKPVYSEEEFCSIYNMDVKSVLKLVDHGIVIPSIWVRNPDSWKESSSIMLPLIKSKKTVVLGERADAYMKLRGPDYNEFVKGHQISLTKKFKRLKRIGKEAELASLSEAVRLGSKENFDLRSFSRGIAKRWGYLDILNPQASEIAKEYNNKYDFNSLAHFTQIAKYWYATKITGTPGANFTLGPTDLPTFDYFFKKLEANNFFQLSSHGKDGTSKNWQDTREDLVYERYQDIYEFVLNAILKLEPLEVMESSSTERLIEFCTTPENSEVLSEIKKIREDLFFQIVYENLEGFNIEERTKNLQKMYREYQDRIKLFSKIHEPTLGFFISFAAGLASTTLPGWSKNIVSFLTSYTQSVIPEKFRYDFKLKHFLMKLLAGPTKGPYNDIFMHTNHIEKLYESHRIQRQRQ